MRDFVVPKTNTKAKNEVRLDYAFHLAAEYDPAHVMPSSKGGRYYQDITGGAVTGARLKANIYPDSGGQYDTLQCNSPIRNVDAHFMLKAENGEYIYVEHVGYRRPDGYYRAIAYIEASTKGPYDWLNNTTFVVTAKESQGGRRVDFYYYVAN
jgi:hypothetical protein